MYFMKKYLFTKEMIPLKFTALRLHAGSSGMPHEAFHAWGFPCPAACSLQAHSASTHDVNRRQCFLSLVLLRMLLCCVSYVLAWRERERKRKRKRK